jgi:hypothetical protein
VLISTLQSFYPPGNGVIGNWVRPRPVLKTTEKRCICPVLIIILLYFSGRSANSLVTTLTELPPLPFPQTMWQVKKSLVITNIMPTWTDSEPVQISWHSEILNLWSIFWYFSKCFMSVLPKWLPLDWNCHNTAQNSTIFDNGQYRNAVQYRFDLIVFLLEGHNLLNFLRGPTVKILLVLSYPFWLHVQPIVAS